MAHRYWVTETVQTFDSKGVRLYKQETVTLFDTLIEAAEHANTAIRVRPVTAGTESRATPRVVIEGQETHAPPEGAFPVLHKCPNCGSSKVYFYDASVSAKMFCSACGKTFMADDGTVL